MDVKTVCLGILSRGAASGYEIKKALEEGPFAHIHAASFGAIYPALAKLTEDGLVTCREEPQDKRPDKKVYAITPTGIETLKSALLAKPEHDRVRSDVLFMLFFAELLPPLHLARIVDERIAWYEASLERMRACNALGQAGHRFVHGLGEAVYSAARDYLKAHRAELLEEVSAAERKAAE